MNNSFFESFISVSYPCYLLDNDGVLMLNDAAKNAPLPLSDEQSMAKLLCSAKKEMTQQKGEEIRTVPLLTEFISMETLTLMMVPQGVFAAVKEERETSVRAFSTAVREPLSNIFATLPLLCSRLDDKEFYLTEDIQQSCYSILRLVSNMENVGSVEKQKYNIQVVDIASLVEAICFASDSVCKAQGIPISWDVPSEPMPVNIDLHIFNEIVMNLLRNSLQYTRDGNSIEVHLVKAGNKALLTVRDKGLGIKPEHMAHIFEPYFSKDPYGDDEAGYNNSIGLGLAVVRRAVLSFGGTVTAESKFGEGTAVHVALPLDLGTDKMLSSTTADYLLNKYSSVYVHLCGYCRMPGL